jgi:hypothetical protein
VQAFYPVTLSLFFGIFCIQVIRAVELSNYRTIKLASVGYGGLLWRVLTMLSAANPSRAKMFRVSTTSRACQATRP